jgi:hypothetical protein
MASFNVNLVDGSAEKDADAANLIVDQENERRAALDPPEAPLPKSNNAELKASYETVLSATLLSAHMSYQKQAAEKKSQDADAKTLWENATNAQRDAAIAALGG